MNPDEVLDKVLSLHHSMVDAWILDGPDTVWERLNTTDATTKQKLLMAYIGAAAKKV